MMILKLEQDLSCLDIEILIRYASMTKDVERMAILLKSAATRVKCNSGGNIQLLNASEIFYIESVDKKTFVYCEKSVYRTEFRLYQLAADLKTAGFIQINKACLLNINTLDSMKTLINSRMEATLTNGERLYVTRRYLDNIRRALKEDSDNEKDSN